MGGISTISHSSMVLNWEQLGGEDHFYPGGSAPVTPAYATAPPVFSPIEVGTFIGLTTQGRWIAETNTFNSNTYIWASAPINGEWRVIAWSDMIHVAYHTEIPIVFTHFIPVSGSINRLIISDSFFAGRFVQMNAGDGTNFVFDSVPQVVPAPQSYILLLTGLALLAGVSRYCRASAG